MKVPQKCIIKLFYIEHLKIKEIAQQLDTTSAYISKIVKQDERYSEEKEFRKSISKKKRLLNQNKFIKTKREKRRIEDNYAALQESHKQATKELSKSRHLSNENYRQWNSSAYTYNSSKKQYEFDNSLGRSFDVPKYIKVK